MVLLEGGNNDDVGTTRGAALRALGGRLRFAMQGQPVNILKGGNNNDVGTTRGAALRALGGGYFVKYGGLACEFIEGRSLWWNRCITLLR